MKTALGIFAMLSAFLISALVSRVVGDFLFCLNLQNEILVNSPDNQYFYSGVRWQDEEHPCGKPRKSMFSEGDEYIIDHPLCNYSADLHEVPTVSYSELAQNPKFYDQKIVRVKGRFQKDFYSNATPDNSKLYMKADSPSGEQPLEFNSSWSGSRKLSNFIELNSPETNSAEVSLIIKFLDCSDNPAVLEINNNNLLQMIILEIEEMKPFIVKGSKLYNLLKGAQSKPMLLIRPNQPEKTSVIQESVSVTIIIDEEGKVITA